VHVYTALGEAANHRGRWSDQARSVERAVQHGRLAGRLVQPSAYGSGFQFLMGPDPADELLRKLDELLQESAHPGLLLNRARALAMLDRLDEAWPLGLQASEKPGELTGGGGENYLAQMATLAGEPGAAAGYPRVLGDRLEAPQRPNHLSTYSPRLRR